jgi:TPP-dependent pyruvate/acetoin dehydrogenase alpha subunit
MKTAPEITASELKQMLERMVLIRTFETMAEQLHAKGELSGPFHSSMGQEAVAVGVCSALREDDVITSTHRGHGHLIAKGADMKLMLAELAGREDGLGRGKSGSMHLVDTGVGAIGENGIVGASVFLATGAALGFQLEGSERVAVGFFGDGGVGQGVLYECLNLASIWSLPVVFVCEDNAYAHSFASRRLSLEGDLVEKARGFGIHADLVDGTDAVEVRGAAARAVEQARSGLGPQVLQAKCYRWKGHNMGDAHHLYRPREEVAGARNRDPLDVMIAHIRTHEPSFDPAVTHEEASAAFDHAWRFAGGSGAPTLDVVHEDVPWA